MQDPAHPGPWQQEGSQPPLYYVLAAAATFWVDTSDMALVRHLNPHVDNGVATADGNVNMVVHRPGAESFPWKGTVLAVHLIRLLSVAMGAATVCLTWRLARVLFPTRPEVALGAAAINAFTPMFVFISSVVNNDSLTVLLCSLALVLMTGKKPLAASREPWSKDGLCYHLLLGLVLGLAALTKESALGLVPLALLAVGLSVWHQYSGTSLSSRLCRVLGHGLLVILPLVGVAGWWYWRNWRLYGDLLGWNVFLDLVGRRAIPADLVQLWQERPSFLAAYWGNFGCLNVPMPAWAYGWLNGVAGLAGLGLVVGLARWLVSRGKAGGPRFSVLVPVLLWPVMVLASWARWSSITPASQGRLVFPAISVWSLLLALGLGSGLPRRWAGGPVAAFAAFLLSLAVTAPWAWIAPAYSFPQALTEEQVALIPHRMEVDFGGVMRLLGYRIGAETVKPGGRLEVTLYWEALRPADRDYTVFVHLLGEGELVVAQRDTFPGLGRLSTMWLEPAFLWADRYVLRVPATAYAPDVAQIEVGVYERTTGLRLPAVGAGGMVLGDHLRFGQVWVQPRPGEVPNPLQIAFGRQMTLVGYALDRRVVQPGETVMLTLYWVGERQMESNYTISAQLIDQTWRKAAQNDGWPQEGAAPTTAWRPGEVVVDRRPLAVYADAVPGVYGVRVVVYILEDGEISLLPAVAAKGEMATDHVVLTRVRVR